MARTWNAAGTRALKATWLAARAAGSVSARLAGPPTARLWFTPWRVPLSERALAKQDEWLRDTTPLSIPFAGRRLAGFSAGEGPAVLLVHGWGERAGALGAFVAPLVEAGFRVVGVDLPGHGASPGGQTDALEIGAALRAAAEAAGGIDGVVAHSMGANGTTLALAEGLPSRAAVLLAPAVRLEHGLEKFGTMFRLPPKAVDGLRATIEHRYGRTVWHDLATDALARRIDCPALIVHDRDDDQVDYADAQLLAEAWPQATLKTTSGLGHNKVVRDPDVIQAALEFLGETIGAQAEPGPHESVRAAR
jgi:pimeloyl-ACP methyl ester carboxylesterase